ncbi:FecR domain-containing protein, partial [Desulfocurvus sp.]|uniref:FecR domain-containing protein n=1 Tax=Desulfocurvus sp. TaxID=2871698 RepID=UPI0025B9CF63
MDSIGNVVGLAGSAQAQSSEGSRPLALGSPVHAGEVLTTGPGAHVEITFTDGSVLAQGENATLTLDQYVYNPEDSGASAMLLDMAQGTFRMITGELAKANPEGVAIRSPLATIGIRGTGADFDVQPGGAMRVGVFQYDGLDLTITTPFGSVVINNANLILDIAPDGRLGELRDYSALERAFFSAVAPILSIPVPGAEDGQDGGGGDDDGTRGQDDEGQDGEGEVEVEVEADEGFTEGDVLDFVAALFAEALADQTLPGAAELPEPQPAPLGTGSDSGPGGDDDPDPRQTTGTTAAASSAPSAEPGQGDGLSGTAYADWLRAYNGPMTVSGLAGPDTLTGSSAADTIYGGTGNDHIDLGSSGADLAYGGAGNDSIRAVSGSGSDTVYGEAGNDTISLYSSNDLAYGGTGDDSITGGAGADTLLGEEGNDKLFGGTGADTLSGGAGDDSLYGNNLANASDGAADTLTGGAGNNALYGDTSDWASYAASASAISFNWAVAAQVDHGDGTDTLTGITRVIGSAGDDTMLGSGGGVTFDGGAGNDSMTGGAGNDSFIGGNGQDTVDGGAGSDTLDLRTASGSVTATFTGGGDGTAAFGGLTTSLAGIEALHGSHRDDTITGDDSTTLLTGQMGDDSIVGGALGETLHGDDEANSASTVAGGATLYAGDDTVRG